MARFDVYANPGRQADSTPFLVDVQSDLFDGLDSRMVIPLRSIQQFPKVKLPNRLIPLVTVKGAKYLLETPKMGAVPQRILKSPVASLARQSDSIREAMDFLFHGY